MLHLVLFWCLAWKVYFPENRIEEVSVENIPWGNPTELVCNQIRCTATTLKESQHRRHGCGIKKDQLFRSNLIFAFPESKIVYLVLSEAYFFSLHSIQGSPSACISWWCLRFHLSSCGVDSGAGRRRYPNIPNIRHIHQIWDIYHIHKIWYIHHIHQIWNIDHIHQIWYIHHIHQIWNIQHIHQIWNIHQFWLIQQIHRKHQIYIFI